MIVLGIDPGTAKMGWGIVKERKVGGKKKKGSRRSSTKKKSSSKIVVEHIEHGMIKTSSRDSKGRRLVVLKEELKQLLKKHRVDVVVAEKIFFNINKRSAISVSQALGVVHLVASESNVPLFEYNALEVKLSVAGYGRADKKVVQNLIKRKLRLKKCPTPIHAADALAAAYYHICKTNND